MDKVTYHADDFRGDNAALIASIDALLSLDDAKALVPHGLGGPSSHAYRLLCAAAHRLATPAPDSEKLREAGRAACTLGVGCEQYGVCYAEAHGQPDQCGSAAQPLDGPMSGEDHLTRAKARAEKRAASGEVTIEGSIYEGMEASLVQHGRTLAHVMRYADAVDLAARLAASPSTHAGSVPALGASA